MNKTLIEYISSNFKAEFKSNPILVFSPGRINLIGEHTDYNNGFVFPAAIDKGIVAAIQKTDAETSKIIALDVNESFKFSLDNISAIPDGNWRNYVIGIVGELQKAGKHIENFNLVFGGDIPDGAGVSSSAALENCVVFGLNELFSLNLSKKEMIFISQKAEHNYVGVKCGIMDQYASMFGQNNSAILLDCKNLEAKIVELTLKEHTILLINTNVKHSLAESAYNERRSICESIASQLKIDSLSEATEQDLLAIKTNLSEEDFQKALYVIQENQRVLNAYEAITQNDIPKLGDLLFASHKGLKNQYKVSCEELDFLVDFSHKTGAVNGARMMGGGFGGCTINIVKTKKLEDFKLNIYNHYKQKFNNSCTFYNVHLSEGTKLLSNI